MAPKTPLRPRNRQQQPAPSPGAVSPGVTQAHLGPGTCGGWWGDGGGGVVPPGGGLRGPGCPCLGETLLSHFRQRLWPKAFWDSPGMRPAARSRRHSPGLLRDLVSTVGARLSHWPPLHHPGLHRAEQKGRLTEVTGYRSRYLLRKGRGKRFLLIKTPSPVRLQVRLSIMVPAPVIGGRMAPAGQSEHATFYYVEGGVSQSSPLWALDPQQRAQAAVGSLRPARGLLCVGAGSSSRTAWPDLLQPRPSFAQTWASLSA